MATWEKGVASDEWEVKMPVEQLTPEVSEGLRDMHQHVSVTLRRLCKEVEIHAQDKDTCRSLASLISEQSQLKESLEESLVQGQGPAKLGMVRALGVTGSLSEAESVSLTGEIQQDTFLHTRTVSLPEVKKELHMWKESAEEELHALFERTKACERVSEAEVRRWIQEGQTVHVLPGKAVCTRKAGVGKRRFRAVVCGNHLPSDADTGGLSTFASGVEAISVRAATAVAARKGWTVSGLDIRTAFLNAPVRANTKMRLVVKPPRLLVDLQLIPSDERWLVSKALYGLTTSPRDWAVHRDAVLRKMKIPSALGFLFLKQGLVDENVWRICDEKGEVHGLLIVYVDDLMCLAEKERASELWRAVRAEWQSTDPSWASEESPLSFCGLEIYQGSGRIWVRQTRYLQDLL